MSAWNLVLQMVSAQGSSITPISCERFVVPGLPRPARIAFLAADAASLAAARAAHQSAVARLAKVPNAHRSACGGPGLFCCMTWREPACTQILVPVIGGPLHPAVAQVMTQWQNGGGRSSQGPGGGQSQIVPVPSQIIPALLPRQLHGIVFQGQSPSLSRLNAAAWYGDPDRLAEIAVHAALGQRPGVFLSYLRREARKVADQLFDGLGQRGYRVFLDRFSGTPGRLFPEELAEEMADKAVLVLLETPGLARSKWTQWEIAFAQRYRLGVVALSYPSATQLRRVAARKKIRSLTRNALSQNDLDDALAFIGQEHAQASLRRRAFFEGLVGAAAASKSGSVHAGAFGLLQVRDRQGAHCADVLPSGRPGQLSDVRTLHESSKTACRLLIGQHEHQPPAARADLAWLAQMVSVHPVGPSLAFRTVQSLC